MASVNDEVLNRGIRHATYLERAKTGEVNRILSMLNNNVLPDLRAQLERRLANIATRGFDTSTRNTRRLRDLIKANKGIIHGGLREAGKQARDRLGEFAITEAEWTARMLNEVVPIDVDFTTPSPPLLRSIVTSRPMEGRLLSDWWEGIAAGTQRRVTQQINIGLVNGEGVAQIVRRLYGTREAGFSDGVLNQTRREVEATVRTAIGHVTNHAAEATWKENKDLIKGVQWVSTLDPRTCPICMGNDGEVTKLEEGERPPAHFNCRCRTVPVLKSAKELGLNLNDLPPSTRASMDGQVPATQTYGEWLAKQPANIQDDALGPGRAKLFREGKVTIKGFTDDRGRMLTLAELREKEGLDPGLPSGERVREQIAQAKAAAERRVLEIEGAIQRAEQSLEASQDRISNKLDEIHALPDPDESMKRLNTYRRTQEYKERDSLQRRVSLLMRKRHEAAFAEPRRAAHAALEIPEHRRAAIRDSPASDRPPAFVKARYDEARGWLSRTVSKDVIDDMDVIYHRTKGRAYAQPYGPEHHVFLDDNNTTGVWIHEIGHNIETKGDGTLEKVRRFYNSRTQGEQPQRLRDVTGDRGYRPSETTRVDRFIHPYMGKDYGGHAYEIVSMGLERLYNDPVGFADKDPEMFDFIVDLARGN